jgi:DNA-binding CsgD family transcriptional regulator
MPTGIYERKPIPTDLFPVGICQCGCGNPTLTARQTYSRLGIKRGEHFHFLRGHHNTARRDRTDQLNNYRVEDCGYVTPCWIWHGKIDHLGYGRITGRGILVHRQSYENAFADFNERLDVLHKCDVRPCMNPEHLYQGTHQDNMRDMRERQRSPRGERHSRAKLTDAQIEELRRLYEGGGFTTRSIAALFSISKSNAHAHISARWRRKP